MKMQCKVGGVLSGAFCLGGLSVCWQIGGGYSCQFRIGVHHKVSHTNYTKKESYQRITLGSQYEMWEKWIRHLRT